MAGKIPQNFIEDLLMRVDIVDVINRRVPLKKKGHEYSACCPFHDEKTPSFTVSPNKQFYHCFGCGEHGSAISFLMQYDHLGFPEAIEDLASDLGIEVPREAGQSTGPDNAPIYAVLEKAASYYAEQLRKHASASRAVDYVKARGLSGTVAKQYALGFAPPGWDNLLNALGTNADAIKQLRLGGLISEPDGKRYDKFRDRIIFPIRDGRGRVIGFGGRVLDDGNPKYLNSPETPVFHKGRELYGLYEARKATRQFDRVIVVEGYMDVLALAQYEIPNVVATLGTATTPDHLEKLFRATNEIVFAFDGDRAGRDAAWKALVIALPHMRQGRQCRFLFLPDGQDPDSMVREVGSTAFIELTRQAPPLSEFLFNKLSNEVEMNSLEGHARLAELGKPLLEKLPGGVYREMMTRKLAEMVGTRNLGIKAPAPANRPAANRGSSELQPAHKAIALLLQYPELAQTESLPTNWQQPATPGKQILQSLLEFLHTSPDLPAAVLIERWEDPEIRKHLGKLAVHSLMLHDDAPQHFLGALKHLAREAVSKERDALQNKFRPSQMTEQEKQRLRQLYGGAEKKTPK